MDGRHLQHHGVGVGLGVVLRHLALAEGVVEGGIDHLGQNAEARRLIAIDADGKLRRAVLQVARGVGKLGQRLKLGENLRRPVIELGEIGVLERVLILAAADAAADGDVLRGLEHEAHALHLGELRAQPIDDVRRRGDALIAGLERDEEASGVGGLRAAGAAHDRANLVDVRIAGHHGAELDHHPGHLLRGNVLRRLRRSR